MTASATAERGRRFAGRTTFRSIGAMIGSTVERQTAATALNGLIFLVRTAQSSRQIAPNAIAIDSSAVRRIRIMHPRRRERSPFTGAWGFHVQLLHEEGKSIGCLIDSLGRGLSRTMPRLRLDSHEDRIGARLRCPESVATNLNV